MIKGWLTLQTGLPANTRVFEFCGSFSPANGLDKFDYAWDANVTGYRFKSINDTNDGTYAFLKKYGYDYMAVDHSCLQNFTADSVMARLNSIAADSRFQYQKQLSNDAFVVFKIS
jgi:hypothetical protein